MNIVNIMDYFKRISLRESRVLTLEFNNGDKYIILVIDYAAEVVSDWFKVSQNQLISNETAPPKDFRKLRFSNVENVVVNGQVITTNWNAFADSALKGRNDVIIWAELRDANPEYELKLELQSLGAVSFTFGLLDVVGRLAKGEKISEHSWEYRDTETGALIDLSQPFQ